MSREQAAALDRQDPLAGFRERYHLPLHNSRECAYFLGNSLGLQPKKAAEYVEEELAPGAPMPSAATSSAHARGRTTRRTSSRRWPRWSAPRKTKSSA